MTTHSRRMVVGKKRVRKLGPTGLYRRWLNGRGPDIPHEVVRPWLEMLLNEHGTQLAVENLIGLSARAQFRILQGGGHCQHETAEKLAFACNKLAELAAITPLAGEVGWGPDGSTSCDPCGTWFHPHYAGGMCEECYDREVRGVGPAEPRDVRMARKVAS